MPISGRLVRINRGGTAIVGARTDNVVINNEPIDITDKDDSGWRTLLADVGARSFSADVEGVIKDATLLAAVVSATGSVLLAAHTVLITGIAQFSGDFYLSNVALGAEQEGVATFTATLESSDAITASLAPYLASGTVSFTGTPTENQTLTAVNGTWAGDATIVFTHEWQRNTVADGNHPGWAAIGGATANTYDLVTADATNFVRLKLTATNSRGATDSFSPALLIAAA